MIKALKIFQYAYIIFAVLFAWDAISNWSLDRSRSYISLLFAALAVFMFFFRKRFRKKFEDRNNQK
ncbi:hypothetical protein [Winogradskyella jejuensis]|uniref:Uncharacterized protein n=1 Tax=Winogradskyella jejuensis TaxID=1089305 RepID=A0A1M5LGA6_9FLAO|nr:hypothetical protein [Winogradskyella jejuensis]SHG63699.1 hypothetical protein SAMN05444148_0604 [Winogradskyella jejuensis]